MSKPQQHQKNRKEQIARSYDAGVSNRAQKPKKDKGKDVATKAIAAPAAALGPTTITAANPGPSNSAAGSKQKSEPTLAEGAAVSRIEHGAAGSSEKPSAADSTQRVVFKSTLDTPFRVEWPSVDRKLAASLRDSVVNAATSAGVPFYQLSRGRKHRRGKKQDSKLDPKDESMDVISSSSKRKRKTSDMDVEGKAIDAPRPTKKRKRDNDDISDDVERQQLKPLPQPELLSSILLGINNVTRHLENQLQHLSTVKRALNGLTAGPTAATNLSIPLKYVLVCKGDIDPLPLVAHIPHLVAGCNSNSSDDASLVILVPLPKGSELLLAQAFGLPRVSVLGIMDSAPSDLLASLRSLSGSFTILRAPWLVIPPAPPPRPTKPSTSSPSAMVVDIEPSSSKNVSTASLIPTHVKQLRTTAPRNMIAAKRERQELRKAARVRLVLHRDKESSEKLRRKMGGGKAMKKHRVIVTSLDAVSAEAP